MKKVISFLLCASYLFFGFSVFAENDLQVSNNQIAISSNYCEVARNEFNILYFDSSNGNIAVENLSIGKIWYSSPLDVSSDTNTSGIEKTNIKSPLCVEFIYTDDEKKTDKTEISNTATECKTSNIKWKKIKNGIKVIFEFGFLELEIPVEFTLKDTYFQASIIYSEIKEKEYTRITAIKLLPAFGAGSMSENGYIVVPDGSGAVINFNNSKSMSEYSSMVYGKEIDTLSFTNVNKTETIRMPVWGVVKSDCAMTGIITEGDDSAAINAYSSYQGKYGYNTVSSKAVYRTNSPVSMFAANFENNNTVNHWCKAAGSKKYTVRYYFLGKEMSSYCGIAATYRDYLLDEKILTKNTKKPTLHLDCYNSITTTDAFLGFKYKKQTSLTTYEQTQKILQQLLDAGIKDISVRLIGWSNSGVNNKKLPSSIKYLRNLGGKSKFNSLIKYADKNRINISSDVDFVYAQKIGRKDAIKTYFNKLIYSYDYRNSVYTEKRDTKQAIANSNKVSEIAKKYLKEYSKTKLNGISLSSFENYCYTDFTKKNTISRYELINNLKDILKLYGKYEITVDNANAYLFKYVDIIAKTPVASSGYEMFDYDIPFYQLVLHGYKTLTTESLSQSVDAKRLYLWALSTGTEPLYNTFFENADAIFETNYDYLFSSTFSFWSNEAIDKYKNCTDVLEAVYDKRITDHKEVETGVIETRFEGGVIVYTNFNDYDCFTSDGLKIEAGNCSLIKG